MKFKRNEKRKVRAALDLTPLIDVVFQLLIFFMLSSTFVVRSSIPIEMPTAQGTSKFEGEDLAITLQYGAGGPDNEGPVVVNDIEIQSWAELTNTLRDFDEQQPDGSVVIRPDKRTPSGRTVAVLGYVSGAGIEKFGIAAEPPQEEQ